MGEVEIVGDSLVVRSHIIIYGSKADNEVAERIRAEIELMWNEPQGNVMIDDGLYDVRFEITAGVQKEITDLEIYQNTDPKNNYFRIEEFVHGNISFVDGIGSNSGYWKLENLYEGSTTAAHEYGHTIGLHHPHHLDIRGGCVPGIMYPRGTLVDAPFQYDPAKPAGVTGGTMHPRYRKVRQEDIKDLRLHKLDFVNGRAVLGEFTNIYHPDHSQISREDFLRPPVFG